MHYHQRSIILMQYLLRNMYLVLFNTHIQSLLPSTQHYHDTGSVHLLVIWYIITNDDITAPFNYHSILPSTFPTSENDKTKISVTKNSINPIKKLKHHFNGYISNIQEIYEGSLKPIGDISRSFIIPYNNIPTKELLI